MLNYDKWKKINESFMMSKPMGVTSPKGLLAYKSLSKKIKHKHKEDEDMEDEEEEIKRDHFRSSHYRGRI